MYSQNDYRFYELYHHGILGQKYGVRNGPPYPLKPSDHSSAEKKAGWRKSLDSGSSNKKDKLLKEARDQYTNDFVKAYRAPTEAARKQFLKEADAAYKKRVSEINGSNQDSKALINKVSKENLADTHQKYGIVADLATIGVATAGYAAVVGIQTGIQAHKNKKEDKLGYDIRAKKRAESGEKIDSKTGFYLKDKKTSRDEDIKAVNPDYKLGGYGSTNNCMLCTVTYDLRRRGYDVEAKKMAGNGLTANSLKSLYKNPDIRKVDDRDPVTGKRPSKVAVSRQNMINNTKTQLSSQKDARGNIMVTWDRPGSGGHSMAYEVKHGSLEILDTQCGKVYKGSDIDRLLSRTNTIQYARLDNLEVKANKLKGVAR